MDPISSISYALSDCTFVLSDASPLGDRAFQSASAKAQNVFGGIPSFAKLDPRAGTSLVEQAQASGQIVSVHSTSSTLLQAIPTLFQLASERVPAVFHVDSRQAAADGQVVESHSRILAARQTGFAILSSDSPQEAHDLALLASLASLHSGVPFLHFFNASAAYSSAAKEAPADALKALVPQQRLAELRARFAPKAAPGKRATPAKEGAEPEKEEVVLSELAAILDHHAAQARQALGPQFLAYQPFEYFGAPQATHVLVALASGAAALEEAVTKLAASGQAVGLIKVRLYRPWLEGRFLQLLPPTAQRLTVLEQTAADSPTPASAGAGFGPLFLDVASSFTGDRWAGGASPPTILSGQFALPLDPAAAQGIFRQAASGFVLTPQQKAKGREQGAGAAQPPRPAGLAEDEAGNPYLKMLRQVFGDTLLLANATGYPSVWGKASSQANTQSLLASAQGVVGAEYGLGLYLAFSQRREHLADLVARALEDPSVPKPEELRQALSLWLRHKDDPKQSRRHAATLGDRLLPAAATTHAALREIYLKRDLLPLATHWLVGADDWGYDVNASGIHHVLSAGEKVNLLILDTQPSSSSSPQQPGGKKDIGLYAMTYGGAYVASIALYSSYSQAIRALVEAAAFPGPSVVLAYLPRVAPQGDEARFPNAASEALAVLKETKRAVDSGYWPLYRWNPAAGEEGEGEGATVAAALSSAGSEAGRSRPAAATTPFSLDSQRIQQDLRGFLERESHLSLLASAEPAFDRALASSLDSSRRAQHARLQQEATDSFSRLLGGLKKGKPLVILFASDGGNAERVARRLEDGAKQRNLDVRVSALDEYPLEDLPQEPHACFVVSTAGQGELPTNGREFWRRYSEATDLNLAGVRFGVFALGDSKYWPLPEDAHYFCKPGVDLDHKLALDGAERLLPLGLGDDQALDGYETALQAWEPALWRALGVEEVVGQGTDKPKAKTVEDIKDESNFLRGTIMQGLEDTSTGALADSDTALTKFHGIYQQDDRDLREERRKQGLEKAFSFMVRVRVPGGLATPAQWLAMDEICDRHANGTIRLTTRQAFQLHGIVKRNLRQSIRDINRSLMDTIAACGDVNRNVMCNPNPHLSEVHAEVQAFARAISDHLTPRTSAYHEIWLEDKQVAGGEPAPPRQPDEEPIYGKHYLPRKFKMAIAIPPNNDVDVFAHCLGYIAIIEGGRLVGYNVTVGGGMGMTHNNKKTFPRLADLLGFCTPEQAVAVGEHVLTVQRDFGDRTNRKHSRLKYTVEDHGIAWYRERVEERLGAKLQPPRPFQFTDNSDRYGWTQGLGGLWHYCLFIQNGRVKDTPHSPLRTGLREIAKVHKGDFRLTPNQHLIIGSVAPEDRPMIEALLQRYGLSNERHSAMRLNSMACVALPTCGLAFAESERYLPDLIGKLETTLEEAGLTHDAITIRMTGCPNGCARPYVAEIALVGKAPGTYNLYLGAGFTGERLNKLFKESVNEEQILAELRPILKRYALERLEGEHFGDFVIRAGIIKATKAGNDFHS